jgi:alkanesulfonate monooxygenase SsuD/methylene tetrahydromethanopterin reductase-like flavin-dependent oxidoreductase (luciferase family)
MEIGVGLPSDLGDDDGPDILAWARRAEQLGFSSLAATDRLAGTTWDPIVALTAAAAVTTRCRLLTNVIVVPHRGSAGHLAKQLLTLDRLSAGRLVVGVGVGDRADDYRIGGQPMAGRHRRLDEMLDDIQAIWSGATPELAALGPRRPEGAPPILMGGRSTSTFHRATRHAAGWTAGISSPDQVRAGITELRRAWAKAGRSRAPHVVALSYFGLGATAPSSTPAYLRRYYAFIGPAAEAVATTAPTDTAGIRSAIDAFAAAGVDELVLLPTLSGLEQLEQLASVALSHPVTSQPSGHLRRAGSWSLPD